MHSYTEILLFSTTLIPVTPSLRRYPPTEKYASLHAQSKLWPPNRRFW